MNSADLVGAVWRKSSRSNGQANCVEVSEVRGLVAVRDSKDATGPVLRFSEGTWKAFVQGLK